MNAFAGISMGERDGCGGREKRFGRGDIPQAGTQQVVENGRHRRAQMLRELRIETALRAACQAGSLGLQCLIGFLWGGVTHCV